MIETCTKRRMILSIVALALLTIVVLILENKLTSSSNYGSETPQPLVHINTSGANKVSPSSPSPLTWSTSKEPNTSTCEVISVVQACQPCTAFEVNSNSPAACQTTVFKEIIKCLPSERYEVRSCSIELSREKVRFLVFESLCFLLFLLSYGYSRLRRSQLERKTIKDIERRLAAGH